nr:zinc ribbon domain-containing protein [Romboutsia sp. Marseille-P6047]
MLGIDKKNKEIKELHNITCNNCDNLSVMKLIKNYTYFHIFFIPIFKWNESYYLMCKNCDSIYSISNEKGNAIEKGLDSNLTYWDLNEIKTDNRCKNCGNKIDNDYRYCPYCGEQI